MPAASKRHLVADALREEIAVGRFVRGQRLPGEHELAERFAVSRGTVRAALAALADEEYIATHGGVGSLVTFDGAALDPRSGWARSIAETGSQIETVVLRIERIDDRELADALGAPTPRFVAVDRLRRVPSGAPVSLERSRVPAVGALDRAVDDGLLDGSLTATLTAAGLVAAHAEQWVDVRPLGEHEAEALGRDAGAPWLHSIRTSRTAGGALVEHVDSLLDPARFRLHMRFGRAS